MAKVMKNDGKSPWLEMLMKPVVEMAQNNVSNKRRNDINRVEEEAVKGRNFQPGAKR